MTCHHYNHGGILREIREKDETEIIAGGDGMATTYCSDFGAMPGSY